MNRAHAYRLIPVLLGSSNAYLLTTKNGALLIDAGSKDKLNRILIVLKRHNLDVGDIKLIILTHSHFDHAGNVNELKEKSGAKLLVHESEAQCVRDGFSPVPRGTNGFAMLVSWLANRFFPRVCSYTPAEPDVIVSDGYDLSDYGIDAQVIHTPGHTSGSLCVVIEKRIAIVGDTMFNFSQKSIYPLFIDDELALLKSWRRLIDIGCQEFYPAHGIHFTKEKLLKTYHRLQ